MCNESYHKIVESTVSKGGLGNIPTTNRPSPPKGQGSNFEYTKEMQNAHGEKMTKAKLDAFYNDISDVHWEDLEFYLNNARTNKDKESFDIAIRILTALRTQVLERKPK